MVREALGHSKSEISKATGTSVRNVGYMRARYAEMKSNPDTEFTGVWWRDKEDRTEEYNDPQLTDKQRERYMTEGADELRTAFNTIRKKCPVGWQDSYGYDLLIKAHGYYHLTNTLSWGGVDPDDEDPFDFLDDDEDSSETIRVANTPSIDPYAPRTPPEYDTDADF